MKLLIGNKQKISKVKILGKYNHMIQIKKIKIKMICNLKRIILLALKSNVKSLARNKILLKSLDNQKVTWIRVGNLNYNKFKSLMTSIT
jgi:hypothetical protein